MKRILAALALILFGILIGAECTIHTARVYREADVYCMDVFGQTHVYSID